MSIMCSNRVQLDGLCITILTLHKSLTSNINIYMRIHMYLVFKELYIL